MAVDPNAQKDNPNPGTGPTGAGAVDPSNNPRPADGTPVQAPPQQASQPGGGGYRPGSESGNPEVHQLLAHRVALQMNRDAITPDTDKLDRARADIDRQLDEVTKQLNALGFA